MNLIKKVSIVLVCLMVFSFCIPNISRADFGGKLMNPVMNLICSLGDSIMTVVQSLTIDFDNTIIDINTATRDESVGDWLLRNVDKVVGTLMVVVGVALCACRTSVGCEDCIDWNGSFVYTSWKGS